jgi:maltooligosyltrehalose trehalohydrolase
MHRSSEGTFSAHVPGIGPGTRYRYRLDGEGPYPDPASRFQPEGVHGPSQVIDPNKYGWTDHAWPGLRAEELVVYELHVGTFTPNATFSGVVEKLPYLRDLGVTAIELMPLGDFPGERNWGYDGVSIFAPARCYGTPDDLRRLVDRAHAHGLGVFLDVVYNHFGPDGAYLGLFSPFYFSRRHETPWGAALNLDGEHGAMVRAFFIENALHWTHEYHFDGLRLDATHALIDDGEPHFLAELAERVHASPRRPGIRPALLVAEDHRNLATMIRPRQQGGWGLDAVWADDFHHQVRRAVAGDHEGYYRDFTGSAADLAQTVRRGWFYCGQYSAHLDTPRGTDAVGLSPHQFVICIQNHDQIGNRAFGDRLHHVTDGDAGAVAERLAAFRAASVLFLLAPETPLLFMGQEWASTSPFLYFTDHNVELGKLVTEGRRREFGAFAAFADPETRARIPDPQARATFEHSRLVWPEIEREPHASAHRLYRALLHLRRNETALRSAGWKGCDVSACGEDTVLLRRAAGATRAFVAVARLRGSGLVRIAADLLGAGSDATTAQVVLNTENPTFCADPSPPLIEDEGATVAVGFARPGALVFSLCR